MHRLFYAIFLRRQLESIKRIDGALLLVNELKKLTAQKSLSDIEAELICRELANFTWYLDSLHLKMIRPEIVATWRKLTESAELAESASKHPNGPESSETRNVSESRKNRLECALRSMERSLRSERCLLVDGSRRKPAGDEVEISDHGRDYIDEEEGRRSPTADPGFNVKEAALFGDLTERFYSSWAFKIAGGMLFATILFALGGTIYVGDQSWKFGDEIDKAKGDVEKDVSEFKTELTNLKTAALTKVVNEIKSELEDPSHEVRTRLADARKNAESLESAVAEINSRLGLLTPDVTAAENDMKALEPRMAQTEKGIGTLAPKLTALNPRITAAETGMDELGPRIEALEPRIAQTEKGIGTLAPKLTALNPRITAAETEMDKLGPRIETLLRRISKAEDTVAQNEGVLSQFNDRIDAVQKRSESVPPIKPVCTRSQNSGCRQIQALLAERYGPLSVDGLWGPNTERALKAFQADLGEPQTGVLNPDQIDRLLRLSGQ